MIKGLSRAGIGKVGPLDQFIRCASQYGFGAVDADGSEIEALIDTYSLEGAKQYLQKHHVQIGAIGLSLEWRQSDEQFRQGIGQLVRDAEAAAKIGCTACCTYILPSTDFPSTDFTLKATQRLRLCAQILAAFNMKLGLEFVGPHHLRTQWKNPFLWDLPSTLDWIDTIHEPNVGLLVDAFHWYTNEHTFDDLLALRKEQIAHVHLNDAPNLPVNEVLDNGRLYPGEGVIDVVGFLKALNQIGYRGVVSQEILTQHPPIETTEQLLKRSQEAFDNVYRAAGLQV